MFEVKTMKKIWEGGEFGLKGSKLVLKLGFFYHFLKVGTLVFLEIAYSDSLQQCLTFSRGKIYEEKFWGSNLVERDQNWS